MSTTVAERVAAGAALLDERDPGWWRADVDRAIDLDELNMESPHKCVLGHRCPLMLRPDDADEFAGGGPYWVYAQALAPVIPGEDEQRLSGRVRDWAADHGFEASWPAPGYRGLAAEWTRVITERRSRS